MGFERCAIRPSERLVIRLGSDEELISARCDPCLYDPLDALKAWCEDDDEGFTLDLDDLDDDLD